MYHELPHRIVTVWLWRQITAFSQRKKLLPGYSISILPLNSFISLKRKGQKCVKSWASPCLASSQQEQCRLCSSKVSWPNTIPFIFLLPFPGGHTVPEHWVRFGWRWDEWGEGFGNKMLKSFRSLIIYYYSWRKNEIPDHSVLGTGFSIKTQTL